MSKGDFIALINPAITFIIATALFILWNFRREHRYVAVLGASFLCLSSGFLLEYVGFGMQDMLAGAKLSALRLTANTLMIVGGCLLVHGTLARYRIGIPIAEMLLVSAVSLSTFIWFLLIDPNMTARICVMNYTGGVLVFLLTAKLYAVPRKRLVDRVLLALFLVWGMEFFVRTTAVVWYEGPYTPGDEFFSTLYWITLTLSFACFLLLLSVILMTAIAMDVFEQLKAESRTDLLTGLSNRRDFEDHLAHAVADARRNGLPLALVQADLDSFKSVNDNYGHAAGDKAIAAFAACLRDHLTRQQCAARIGGEEFAIVLPAADIGVARLFAEAVRIAFSTSPVEGLPTAERLTASFGIAELQPQEDGSGLMRRADAALYSAKHNGRDRVILAEESLVLFHTPQQDRLEPRPHAAGNHAANDH